MTTATRISSPPRYLRVLGAKGLRAGDGGVDREGRVIRGVSVITRGEALGHGLWIDKDFIAETISAGNVLDRGIKARFTHPGLSSDGLGKMLGHFRNFRAADRGNRAVADLHFIDATRSSPAAPAGKDLAEHVMDLAEEAPEDFGNSIVFEHDEDAASDFRQEHVDDSGRFKSPDRKNVNNFPHARLAGLRASDIVDEPAANPAGFFSFVDGSETATLAERALDYLLGRTDEAPDESIMGFDPVRAKRFMQNYFDRHGMYIAGPAERPRGGVKVFRYEIKSNPDWDGPEPEQSTAADPAEEVIDMSNTAEQAAELKAAEDKALESGRAAGAADSVSSFKSLRDRFPGEDAFVADQFEREATLEQAERAFVELENKRLKAENERLKKGGGALDPLPELGADPVNVAGDDHGDGDVDFLDAARSRAAKTGRKLTECMRELRRENPKLHERYLATMRKYAKARA